MKRRSARIVVTKIFFALALAAAGFCVSPTTARAFQVPCDGCYPAPAYTTGYYPYAYRYYGSVSPYPVGYYPYPGYYGYSALSAGYAMSYYPYALPYPSYPVAAPFAYRYYGYPVWGYPTWPYYYGWPSWGTYYPYGFGF